MQALAQPPSTRALLRALLLAMVSTNDEGRSEAPLWVTFLARAIVESDLAVPLRTGGKAMVDFAADQLRSAQEAGEVARSLDPELEATSLFALADGLMIRTLLDPDQTAAALAAIDYQLDRIFDGEGSAPTTQAPNNRMASPPLVWASAPSGSYGRRPGRCLRGGGCLAQPAAPPERVGEHGDQHQEWHRLADDGEAEQGVGDRHREAREVCPAGRVR